MSVRVQSSKLLDAMANGKGLSLTFPEHRIAILRMKRGQNRINIEFIEAFNECLDKIEQ